MRPLEVCDNLVNALERLANQQIDGDSPIKSVVTGLHERSRIGIMEGLRSFIEVDNRSAVDVGGLRRGTMSIQVMKLKFSEALPDAVIREGADELTFGFVANLHRSTKHIELERWGPPVVDAGWHASCQAKHKGIEGKEGEALYSHFRELHQATATKKPGDSQEARPFGQ